MQLRKVSNHPLLERYIYGTDLLTKMAHDYCDVSSHCLYKSPLLSLMLKHAYPSCLLSLKNAHAGGERLSCVNVCFRNFSRFFPAMVVQLICTSFVCR